MRSDPGFEIAEAPQICAKRAGKSTETNRLPRNNYLEIAGGKRFQKVIQQNRFPVV
jgi:hypothetical protein